MTFDVLNIFNCLIEPYQVGCHVFGRELVLNVVARGAEFGVVIAEGEAADVLHFAEAEWAADERLSQSQSHAVTSVHSTAEIDAMLQSKQVASLVAYGLKIERKLHLK